MSRSFSSCVFLQVDRNICTPHSTLRGAREVGGGREEAGGSLSGAHCSHSHRLSSFCAHTHVPKKSMAGPDAPELLALVMAHLDELGLAESLACLQRESGVPHVPGHFAPAELSRRLESSAAPAASTGIAAAAELTPELDLLTAGRGDYVSAELDQLSGCHTGNITCARWVRDGTVISGGADRQLCVTRLDGSPRSSMPLDAAALSLDVLDYGSGRYVVAVGCMDGSTSLFSVGTDGTMMLVRRAKHHLKYNHAVRWNTTGGKQLATASFDHQVHVYPATVAAPPDEAQPSGALEPAERLYFHGVVEDIAWAGGGTVLAAAVRNDHRLHLFSAGTGGGALERRCAGVAIRHSLPKPLFARPARAPRKHCSRLVAENMHTRPPWKARALPSSPVPPKPPCPTTPDCLSGCFTSTRIRWTISAPSRSSAWPRHPMAAGWPRTQTRGRSCCCACRPASASGRCTALPATSTAGRSRRGTPPGATSTRAQTTRLGRSWCGSSRPNAR